jgi:hypothetical protein
MPASASPTGSLSNPDILLHGWHSQPDDDRARRVQYSPGDDGDRDREAVRWGNESTTSTPRAGTLAASTATASLTIPTNQSSVISASATFTLTAVPGVDPLLAQGEPVDRVRVAAALGGPSRVAYVTTSGREVPTYASEDSR